jgi:hypothetical protein
VALRLAREGYCGGDPEKVLQMRADLVMAAVQYENYRAEYERTFVELNREKA